MAYPPVFSLKTTSLDGSVQRQLPIGEAGYASYVEPDIHASGSLVASRVHMQSDIYRYPVEGTASENTAKATRITRQTGQVQTPSASPDGNEVAYLSDSGGHANVWVATVDGSRPPRPITFEDDPSVVVGIPRWSPGGDRIVYIRQRVGGRGEEWLVNPDGTGHRMLVPSGAGAFWSNDGKWLYYFVFNEDPSAPCTYKVSADGGPEIQVRCGSAGMMVTADGSTAFMIASHLLQGEIWKVTPVETGKPEPFVNLQSRLPLLPHHFDLSPDDHWLATPLKDRGTTNLWKVSTRDASLHQITDFGQRATLIARQVAWSRDSKYIFAALVEMDADIVLIDGALDR